MSARVRTRRGREEERGRGRSPYCQGRKGGKRPCKAETAQGSLGQLLIDWQKLRRMLSQAQVKQERVPKATSDTCHGQSVSKEEQANLLHATPPPVILEADLQWAMRVLPQQVKIERIQTF